MALKHHKEDKTEILAGSECGVSFLTFHDLRPDDIIECVHVDMVDPVLE